MPIRTVLAGRPCTCCDALKAGCMQGRFDPASFSAEVMEVASKLVPATITLWSRVAARMLPTPAKFHYLFNMRELSKVALGLVANLILCNQVQCTS